MLLVYLVAFFVYVTHGSHACRARNGKIVILPGNPNAQEPWEDLQNPWELSGHCEGDIILTSRRNVIENATRKWPNGIVPYRIKSTFNETETAIVLSAMETLSSKTCIKFVPRQNEHEHGIFLTDNPERGCSSMIGMQQEETQMLNLARERRCINYGTILHELLHVLGFWHQHSAKNRNTYITIEWKNIRERAHPNFVRALDDTTSFGLPYDYNSIMHYSEYAFSANGNRTVIPKDKNAKIGQRTHLSEIDIMKIRRAYC